MPTPRVGATGVGVAQGDLYVVDSNLELQRLAVGVDGQLLVADSAQPEGLRWGGPNFVMGFGANFPNAGTTGRYLLINGQANSNSATALDATAEGIVTKAGTLTAVGWRRTNAGGAGTTFNVIVNGLVVGSWIATPGLAGVNTLSIPLVVGDRLTLQYGGGEIPGNVNIQVLVT